MQLISRTEDLAEACARLGAAPFVAVDTEFMREQTFWPRLCLIQMAANGTEVLVDSLAPGIDLQPFFDLMVNEQVLKVFHSARQDIEIVHHLAGVIPHPIFDTQVAAMVCGFGDSVSYDQLVQKITGKHIDKSSRFTDWSHRPLSQKQLDYALADVTHLRDIYASLKAELEREGRAHWLEDEMAVLETPETYDLHPDDAWTRMKMRVRKPSELAVLMKVTAWREREARNRDVPRGRILKDDAIYEIAQQQPRDAEALGKLRTVPRGWERSASGAAIIAAVNEALAIPKEELPKIAKPYQPNEGTQSAVELLKVLLKLTAEREGVAAKIIANTDDLEKIASEGEKADVAAMHGWRKELFGDRALKLIDGQLVIKFVNRKIEAVELDLPEAPSEA
jgi:ribonuclease D